MDTVGKAVARIQRIADQQYLAEKALIDATYPENMPAWCIDRRIRALGEIYRDLMNRLVEGGA